MSARAVLVDVVFALTHPETKFGLVTVLRAYLVQGQFEAHTTKGKLQNVYCFHNQTQTAQFRTG